MGERIVLVCGFQLLATIKDRGFRLSVKIDMNVLNTAALSYCSRCVKNSMHGLLFMSDHPKSSWTYGNKSTHTFAKAVQMSNLVVVY